MGGQTGEATKLMNKQLVKESEVEVKVVENKASTEDSTSGIHSISEDENKATKSKQH